MQAFAHCNARGPRFASTRRAGQKVFRVPAMESALSANFSADALNGIKVPAADLRSDSTASAEYRAHLVTVRVTKERARAPF
jgi:aerobic carbon-monoxide dehydrogenase medium subunit